MPDYSVTLRAHVTVTIRADDPEDLHRRLGKWRVTNRAKQFGRRAVAVIIPGDALLALDEEKMPVRQQQLKLHGG